MAAIQLLMNIIDMEAASILGLCAYLDATKGFGVAVLPCHYV